MDVIHHCCEMRFVAHDAIEVVSLPERPFAPQAPIGRFRGVGLPGVQNGGQVASVQHRHQRVDVIGHDYPSVQEVANVVEKQQGLLHDCSYLGAAQPAGAVALIKRCLRALPHFGGAPCYWQIRQLGAPLRQGGLRKAIGQPKADVLGHFPRFKVRQMASVVLAGRSATSNLACLLHDR